MIQNVQSWISRILDRKGYYNPNNKADFFVYSATFASLATGTTAIQTVTVQADSDFVLDKITYFADLAAAAVTDSGRVIPLTTLQITDQSSGFSIFDNPVPLANIAGTGNEPFLLPAPGRLFSARTTISLSMANFSAATTYNVRVALIGRRLMAK